MPARDSPGTILLLLATNLRWVQMWSVGSLGRFPTTKVPSEPMAYKCRHADKGSSSPNGLNCCSWPEDRTLRAVICFAEECRFLFLEAPKSQGEGDPFFLIDHRAHLFR